MMEKECENKVLKRCTQIILLTILTPYLSRYIIFILNKLSNGALTNIEYELRHVMTFLLWILFAKYIGRFVYKKKSERSEKRAKVIDNFILFLILILIDISLMRVLSKTILGDFIDIFYKNTEHPTSSVLSVCVLLPIMEEIKFRYIGMGVLNQYNKLFSFIAVTVVFALGHGFPNILIIIVPCIALGLIYALTDNILWPILLHISHNSLANSGLMTAHQSSFMLLALSIALILLLAYILSKSSFYAKLFEQKYYLTLAKNFASNKNLYKRFFCSQAMMIFYFLTIINAFLLFIS